VVILLQYLQQTMYFSDYLNCERTAINDGVIPSSTSKAEKK